MGLESLITFESSITQIHYLSNVKGNKKTSEDKKKFFNLSHDNIKKYIGL